MKTLTKAALLCGFVLAVSAGCNSNPAGTSGTTSAADKAKVQAMAPELRNTPAKSYAGAPPDIQAKMQGMAAGTHGGK